MIAFGWFLIAVTLIVVVAQLLYFRRLRKQCEKYPFFILRDEVIEALLTEGATPELLRTYEVSNRLVNELSKFNFRYHAKAMTDFIHSLVEEAYSAGFDPKMVARRAAKLHPLQVKLGRQIINTASKNNFLINLAITPIGTRLLMRATFPVVWIRFLRNHPELERKLRATKEYAQARFIFAS